MDNPTIFILIVEDDAAHAKAIGRALAEAGGLYRVETVSSLGEFHDKIARFLPGLVIADLNLPDGKAFDILAHADKANRYPVLVMTAFGDEAIAVRAMKTGALDYIVKSEHAFRELPHIVERALREWRLIQNHKQAEDALKESEEKFRTHVENSFDIIFTLNKQGQFVFLSEAWERHFGYPVRDAIGRNFELFVHPDDVALCAEYLLRVLNTRRSAMSPPFRVKCSNGDWPWFVANGTPYADSKGELLFFGVGRDMTEQKRAEDERTALIHQLRELSQHVQSIREEESRRIAARIHDEVGQALSAACMDVELLEEALGVVQGKAAKLLPILANTLKGAVTTVQNIAMDLRPAILDDLGLVAALGWSIQEFERRLNIPCRLEARNLPDEIDPALSIALYRIAQECLTNVARHAQATELSTQLECNGREVELIVRDNGRGLDKEKLSDASSFGLLQMRERAITLGGTLSIESEKGKGTVVRAAIPLR